MKTSLQVPSSYMLATLQDLATRLLAYCCGAVFDGCILLSITSSSSVIPNLLQFFWAKILFLRKILWPDAVVTDQSGDGDWLVLDSHKAIEHFYQRLIDVVGQYPHGRSFVTTIYITCKLECCQETNYGYRIFCVKEVHLRLQLELLSSLAIKLKSLSSYFDDFISEPKRLTVKSLSKIFLYVLDNGKLRLHLFFFSQFLHLGHHGFYFGDADNESTFNEPLENDHGFFCLGRLFRSTSCGWSVILVLSITNLRNFTSIEESDTEGDVAARESKDSCFFPILSF